MASRAWTRIKSWCPACCRGQEEQDEETGQHSRRVRRADGNDSADDDEIDPLDGDSDEGGFAFALGGEDRSAHPAAAYIDDLVLQTLARIRTLVDK